ncbi:DgyrCDS6610 [Dimorphilus gyrociliatus]|uniref:protein-tyrosine-phosphatase n=1 Tax=Dimorphilus gyrociliatus TaxID=2664684 RepID=A0A7I8VQ41_9ANNE|nr:DgyrCDS6610 [Dimorphilus gyrociliatus]
MTKLMKNLETSIAEFDRLLSDKDYKEIHQQFNLLKEFSVNLRKEKKVNVEAAKKPSNTKKNRYGDILPFDETRVILEDDGSGGDYINANWIKGTNDKRAYIATQGPIELTIPHFWRMLWQTNASTVIMACNFEENGKKKCADYWISGGLRIFGDQISVGVVSETEINSSFSYRKFKITNRKEERFIHHYHYTAWPDYGAPKNVEDCIELLELARKENKGIMVIHCSAGCGRTGAICALDYCWSLVEEEKVPQTINLYKIVENLRRQRQSMVQAVEQLIFLYSAVRELYHRQLKILKKKNRSSEVMKHIYENQDAVCEIFVGGKTDNSKPKPGFTKLAVRQNQEKEHSYVNIHLKDSPLNETPSAEETSESYTFGEGVKNENKRDDVIYEPVTCVQPKEDNVVSRVTPKKPNVKINENANNEEDIEKAHKKPKDKPERKKAVDLSRFAVSNKITNRLRRNKNPHSAIDSAADQCCLEPAEICCNGQSLSFPNKIDNVGGPRELPGKFENLGI